MTWAALFERATPSETTVETVRETVRETLRDHRKSADDA
jgi:hypothetical protein